MGSSVLWIGELRKAVIRVAWSEPTASSRRPRELAEACRSPRR
jgi:hypothetical protein